jgi:L-threonylcarbamoyladenylate synthase
LLAAGELVAIPTETVYGLAADAANPAAVMKIFALKGRPADHPLIVHIGDPGAVDDWAAHVPPAGRLLAERFWPGPLTLILPRAANVPGEVTGGQDSVGIRCPSHPVAQQLLREFARIGSGAVAAPSANRFGHVSPTTAQHVRDEFGAALAIVDGGACNVGLESAIVDLTRADPVLLRPGGISRQALEAALGRRLLDRDADAPRASGTLASHYAPGTPLELVSARDLAYVPVQEAAVLGFEPPRAEPAARLWIQASPDPLEYGHDLYAHLRALDAAGARRILVQAPPDLPEWEAVNDRLRRAAFGATDLQDEP